MRSILEEFAYGNISPEDQCFESDSQYGQAMDAADSNEKKLIESMDEKEKALLEKYTDARDEINQLTAVNNFIYGYKLGVLMIAEAFVTSDDLITGYKDC